MTNPIELPRYPLAPGARSGVVTKARAKYRQAIKTIDDALAQTEQSFEAVFAREDSTATVRERISRAASENKKGRR